MDQLGGVDFNKGCYVGQEVVSRMEHRGTARTRAVPIRYDGTAPAIGAPITAGAKQIGTMGSTAGGRGVALVRLDRAAEAIAEGGALTAGGSAGPAGQAGMGAFCFSRRTGARRRKGRRMTALSRRTIQASGIKRCPWPKDDPLYIAYHDEEWGVPEYDDRALYEKLVLDGFQAGLSWITILRKRENFRRAFDDFAPEKIARYRPAKIEKPDGRRRHRAQPRQDRRRGALGARLARCHGQGPWLFQAAVGFRRRPAEDQPLPHRPGQVPAETAISRAMSKELAQRGFKFCGPTIVYAFMQAVGMVNDHLISCYRHDAVQKLGRKASA